MKTERFEYCTTVNGIEYKYEMNIIADLAALCICSICGFPDCGADQFLWAEFDDERQAIHFGGGIFGTFLQRWHYDGITEDDYKKLPDFIREYNECRGWTDFPNPSVVIDAIDFKRSLEVIRNSVHTKDNDDFMLHYNKVMNDFVDKVIIEKKVLNILE